MKTLALIAVLITGALLLYAVADFPAFGDPKSPANASNISTHYITQAQPETHVPNMVTAILADYRGYDTLFETVVIFTAGTAIIAILGLYPVRFQSQKLPPDVEVKDRDLIIIQTCRMLLPVIQLFGLYVIAHGHYSPGGGFQGGVILGASLILWAIARDLPAALNRVSIRRAMILASVGILIYAGIGALCLVFNGNFLDYSALHTVLPETNGIMARYWGMFGVEVGVAFTVSMVMFSIYANLASKGKLKGGL